MIGNGGLGRRGFTKQHDVAAALSIDFKTNLAKRLDAFCAGDDGQFAHAATSTNSTRSGEGFVTGLSLADATGKARNFGNNKTVFAGI